MSREVRCHPVARVNIHTCQQKQAKLVDTTYIQTQSGSCVTHVILPVTYETTYSNSTGQLTFKQI